MPVYQYFGRLLLGTGDNQQRVTSARSAVQSAAADCEAQLSSGSRLRQSWTSLPAGSGRSWPLSLRRVDTTATIPDALAALAAQLVTRLPNGPVTWSIQIPPGTEHRGSDALDGRLDRSPWAVDDSSTSSDQLHRSADGRHQPPERQGREP